MNDEIYLKRLAMLEDAIKDTIEDIRDKETQGRSMLYIQYGTLAGLEKALVIMNGRKDGQPNPLGE